MIRDPKDHGNYHAQQNTYDDRKIKIAVAAMIGNIAGEMAEAEGNSRAQGEGQPGCDQNCAGDYQELSHIS